MLDRRALIFLVAVVLLGSCTAEDDASRRDASTAKRPEQRGPSERRSCEDLDVLVERVRRGYVPFASPDISVIPREPNYLGPAESPVHSGPWDYLSRVPLVMYGPGHVERGVASRQAATMADVAPTVASLVGFDGGRFAGNVLRDGLADARRPPRLVVAIVWDGGGINVLREHPRATPFLDELRDRGTSYERMTLGSSPSVTPPVHTTLGTGVFPDEHGIAGLNARVAPGEYVDPMLFIDPSNIAVPALADVYDRSTGNRAITGMLGSANWHIGMIGHGTSFPGGDADPVVLIDEDGVGYSNTDIYSLPDVDDPLALERALDELDRSDGETDGAWRGTSLAGGDTARAVQAIKGTPAWASYNGKVLQRLISNQGFGADEIPDLLFVNFKSSDEAGHRWGMTSRQTAEALRAQDEALEDLVRFLDAEVGERRWVVMVTADHGQTPYPHETGAWAIRGAEVGEDANARFDDNGNDIPLVENVVSAGLYVRRDELRANEVRSDEIARWLSRYTPGDNAERQQMPSGWEGRERERLFDAVLVRDDRVFSHCR